VSHECPATQAAAAAEKDARKVEEDKDRRDSGWKSRQSSLATPQDPSEK